MDPLKSEVGFGLIANEKAVENDEAEEAENEEDLRRRQEELQNMLANAFDDIGIDEDNSTFNSSFNETHRTSGQHSGFNSRQHSGYDPRGHSDYDSRHYDNPNYESTDFGQTPGYEPRQNPGFEPKENSGYDHRQNPGYDPNENSGYDPSQNLVFEENPRQNPGYDPNLVQTEYSDINFDEKYRDATYNSLEQLQVLYQVQVREIQRLSKELIQTRTDSEKERQLLKKNLLLTEAEYSGIKISLKQSQDLLVEKTSKIDENLNEIDYLKNSLRLLQESKNVSDEELQLWKTKSLELEQKLSLIEKGLYVPVSEKQVRSKYEQEINDLQTSLEQTRKDLEHSRKTNAILENEIDGLKQAKEMVQVQKDDEIHNLYSQLENTKHKCQNLTEKVEYLEKEHQNLTVLLNTTKENESKVEFTGTVKILQQELKRSLDDQKSKRDEILRLEEKLKETADKLKEMEEVEKENVLLKERNEKMVEEIERYKEVKENLEGVVEKQKEDYEKLRDENRGLREENEGLRREVDVEKTVRNEKESEVKDLKIQHQKLIEENSELIENNRLLTEENQWMKENQIWEDNVMAEKTKMSIENRLSQNFDKENRAPKLEFKSPKGNNTEKNRLLQPIQLGDNRQVLTDDQLMEANQISKPDQVSKPYEELIIENQKLSTTNLQLGQEKQNLLGQTEKLTNQIEILNRKINEDFEIDKIKLENIEDENDTLKKLIDELEKQLILIEKRNPSQKSPQSLEDECEILKNQYGDLQRQLKETELNGEMWKKQLGKYEKLCLELQETCAQQKGKLYENQSKITELESKLILKEKRDDLLDDLQQKALMFEQYIKAKTELSTNDKAVDTEDLKVVNDIQVDGETKQNSPKLNPPQTEPLLEQISKLSSENKSLKEKVVFDRKALNELTNVWNSEINRLNTLVNDLKKELDTKNANYVKNQESVNNELSRMTTIIKKLAENLKIKDNYIKECQDKENKHLKDYQAKKERLRNEFQSREKSLLHEQAQNIMRIKSEYEMKEENLKMKLDNAKRSYSDGLLKIQDKLTVEIKRTEEKSELDGKIIEAYYDMMIHKAMAKKPLRKTKM